MVNFKGKCLVAGMYSWKVIWVVESFEGDGLVVVGRE